MSGIVYSGSYPNGIVLSDPATQNPATIASTGYVYKYNGAAVLGQAPTAWTVTNQGIVKAAGTAGIGIELDAGGTITNTGTVNATGTAGLGIKLTAGGTLTNGQSGAAGGLVLGGVRVYGATGSVTNFGSIANGVTLAAGGNVSNNANGAFGGTITGNITISGGAGMVGNSGSIGGTVSLTGAGTVSDTGRITGGVSLAGGGTVMVGQSGAPFGYVGGTGIYVNGAGTVTNFGTLTGQYRGAGFTHADSAIRIHGSAGGTVTNFGMVLEGSEVFGGGGAISVSAGYVNNSGLIQTGFLGIHAGNYLSSASTVTNFGTISAGGAGVGIFGSLGTFTNFGMLSASTNGVYFTRVGGTVINRGTISAPQAAVSLYGNGVVINGQSGSSAGLITGSIVNAGFTSLTNFASIAGSIALNGGGNVSNAGSIGGGIKGTNATIANTGSIGNGVSLSSGGTIGNGSALATVTGGMSITGAGVVTNYGTITGNVGLYLKYSQGANDTVTNAGTITGTGGTAIQFGVGNDLLLLKPGAMLNGTVNGAAGNNAIELAVGSGTGRLNGLGSSVVNFSAVTFDGAASWVAGVDDPTTFTGTFFGFSSNDTIDLTNRVATSETYGNGQLTLTNTGTVVAILNISGNYTTSNFMLAPDGQGGTDITVNTPPDTTAPSIVTDNPLQVGRGSTAPITASLLQASDPDNTDSQLTFTVTSGPSNGTLLKNGTAVTSFTQADIDNGAISYSETNIAASSDMFSFTVRDPVANATAGSFQITVTPPPLSAPQLVLTTFGQSSDWTSQDRNPRQVADVTGDGRADLVGFADSGVYVAPALGGGGFAAPNLALAAFGVSTSWTSQDAYPRFLADVNGDGLADIVGFGQAGVYVSLNTGGGNFAAPFLALNAFGMDETWSSQTQYPRMLADVNGDGKADIVGFGSAGVYVSLATGGGNFSAPFLALSAFAAPGGWTSQDAYPRSWRM